MVAEIKGQAALGERVVLKLKDGREVTGTLMGILPSQIQEVTVGGVTELHVTAEGIMLHCDFADVVYFQNQEIEKMFKPH